MDFAELRALPVFDGLDDDQLGVLFQAGEEVDCPAGVDLWVEGKPADDWWVLLEGSVDLVRRVGTEDTVLGAMSTPGQWAGGFGAWDEHGVYFATGRSAGGARCFRVSAETLRECSHTWFPFGVHFIEGLVNTVRRIEAGARQREALVALGSLAAGLAHELNNPAAAATRAVDALEETSRALLDAVARLANGEVTAQQYVELDALRRDALTVPRELDALATAEAEEALSDWLSEHDIDRDWLIAPVLAAAGVDVGWCERVDEVLGGRSLQAGMDWLSSSLAMAALLGEVKESTTRVSDLVAAVRSYSQLDRAPVQQVDVVEGLESTLTMLAAKLRDVDVVRDYGDVPTVEGMAGELNQVWTNVIDNAIDAMHGRGTLRVSTRADAHGVVTVEIADSGAGMPPEVQAQAFDPFFTTKDVGKGTGLGLDISRRIVVERHQGDISIDSEPGSTVLSVRLRSSLSGS